MAVTVVREADPVAMPAAWESLFENAVEGMFLCWPDGRYFRVNPALAELYGYASPGDMMAGTTDTAEHFFADPRVRTRYVQLMKERGVVRDLHYEIPCKSGPTRWVSRTARAVRDETGVTLYHEGHVVDITERMKLEETRRRLEDELQRAHQLVTLGAVAGGVAHDLRTLLHIVDGYADLAGEALDAAEVGLAHGHVNRIRKAIQRGNGLVDRIGSFGAAVEEHREPVAVDALVIDIVRMLEATVPRNIEVRQRIELDPGHVLADPLQILQIVINLCTNAFRAMSERGGVLSVSLSHERIAASATGRPSGLEPGDYLCLTIADNGPGMDEVVARRAFEPFFSTKRGDEPLSGFGLAIVEDHARRLGGAVRVNTAPGAGAEFTIYLPVHNDGRATRANAPAHYETRTLRAANDRT
jgi:PAS domain S-box-containing protein